MGAGDAVKAGLACADHGVPADESPLGWLRAGYPRTALAVAKGIPFAPYPFNVRATFQGPDQPSIVNVGPDLQRVTMDTIIEGIIVSGTFDRPPANVFQTLSDFFFNFQSGIEAIMNVEGAPRPSIVPNYTPIRSFADVLNARYPRGWVLTPTQSLKMSFTARIALPEFPYTVVMTFRAKCPINDELVNMSARQAIEELRACGVPVPEGYLACCK